MGGMDGMSLAESIRRKGEVARIALLAGCSDYIAGGCGAVARRNRVKSVNRAKRFSALDRAAEEPRQNQRCLDGTFYRVGRVMIVDLRQIRRVTRAEVRLAGFTALNEAARI